MVLGILGHTNYSKYGCIMKKLILLLLVMVAVSAHADTWTLPSNIEDVILQSSDEIQICSGTGNVSIATGCTGGGTQYTHTFFAADGSVTLGGSFTTDKLILTDNGTAAAPAIQSADPSDNSGFYFDGSGGIYTTSNGQRQFYTRSDIGTFFDFGGVNQMSITGSGIEVEGSTRFFWNVGTAAAPGLAIRGDSDTGLYWVTANTIGVSAGGSQIATFDSGGLTMADTVDITFPDTGELIWSNGAGIRASTANALRFSINSSDELYLLSSALYPTVNNGLTLGTTANGFGSITLTSPDGTTATCSVDNSDNFTCTGN